MKNVESRQNMFVTFLIAVTRHHDQGDLEKKKFTGGLTVLEDKSVSFMVGSTAAGRQAGSTAAGRQGARQQAGMSLEQ